VQDLAAAENISAASCG